MSEGTIAPEQIIINGQEYNPEEASSLIELGNKYRKMETDLNTPLDKLMPEYTRATQERATFKKQLEERETEIEKYKSQIKVADTPKEKLDIIKAARESGLADQEWVSNEYVKKSDLDDYFNKRQSQQQLVDNVIKTATSLEKEIDGSDGRVPFDQKAVLAYASAYQINDLKDAYEQMNERANAKWKAAEIERAQRPGLTTLGPGGKKVPVEKKIISDDDFKNAWEELYGGNN